MDQVVYKGQDLSVKDTLSLLHAHLELSPHVLDQVASNRHAMEKLLHESDQRYYGINTGFGTMHNIEISDQDVHQLQTNLIRSHSCGVGSPAPWMIVRLTLLLKILSLAKGNSGVRPELIRLLTMLYNHNILPVVPTWGSLGASGDLAPLSHVSLPLIGEGEVLYNRQQIQAARALEIAGIEPLQLGAKEGLALINGTQYSLAWLLYSFDQAKRLAEIADMCAALSIDAYHGNQSPFHPRIHQLRKQKGQEIAAAVISRWLDKSEIFNSTKSHVQDPYSFRCAPQVHGATRDTIQYVEDIIEKEINAVTDNPIVLHENDTAQIVSGGNFHAQPLSLAADFLSISMAELGSISERRSFLLLSGQRGLPVALAKNPGLESGLMICQYTAASLVNRNKVLAVPASTDTITTSAGQEDHVSMAAGAGVKLHEIIQHIWKILSIEWMLAAQALEYRRPQKTSASLEEIHAAYRQFVPSLAGDRVLSDDIEKTENFLRKISM
jgi:histidine ammonia-lyase